MSGFEVPGLIDPGPLLERGFLSNRFFQWGPQDFDVDM